MTGRFIVRLVDADGGLLAWATVLADARPQLTGASCPFWAAGPTAFVIERDGLATAVTVHWADLDVARRQTILEPVPVQAGQTFSFAWLEPVWLVPGMRDVPLPPVTVRQPVSVPVAPGALLATP